MGKSKKIRRDGFYTGKLGPTLRSLMDAMMARSQPELVQLYEELALARVMTMNALKLAEPVLSGEIKVSDGAMVTAMSLLRDATDHVKSMCLAISQIDKNAEDKVSIGTVGLFVDQVVRAVYRVCGDEHHELARKIEREIERNVKPPEREVTGLMADGTLITPDQAAAAMDESVTG